MKPRLANLLLATSVVISFSTASIRAEDLHKANNTDALNAATSWTEGTVPTSTANLIWDSTRTSSGLYSFGSGQFTGGVTIQDPGGLVQLRVAANGTATFANNALIDMSAATVDAEWTGGAMRIDNGNYAPTFNVAAGRTLTIGGNGFNNRGNTKTFTFTGAGDVIINANSGSGGAMNFNVNGATVTMNNAASGWTYGTVSSGKLVIGNSTVLSGKQLTVNAANGLGFGTAVTTASLGGLGGSGSFALTNADTNAVALTLGSNNTSYTLSGEISGAGSLVKTGGGTQTFTATNTYAGGTTISAGQVTLDAEFATLGSGTVSLSNGAILQMHRGNASDNLSYGTAFANELNIATGQSGTVYNMARGDWSGALTGNGTLNLRVNASRGDVSGDWSAFSGQVNVTARTGNDDFRLDGGAVGLDLSNGKLNLAAGVNMYQGNNPPSSGDLTTVHHIGELSGAAGSYIGGNGVSGRHTNYTIGALDTDSTYAGVITDSSGDTSLTKVGTGTLTLSGVNTYTGDTLISGGTLKLDATGSINSSTVSIGTGGTFDVSAKGGYTVDTFVGTGDVLGALTVSTELSIGNSPGTTDFSSDLTMGAGSTYTYEVDGGGSAADLGNVTGNLTIEAGAILDLVQLGTFTGGDKFTLFSYSGSQSGTFDGLADDSIFAAGGGDWLINYNDTVAGLNGGTFSNFVTVTAVVPEPSAAVLGGLGLLALLRRRRG